MAFKKPHAFNPADEEVQSVSNDPVGEDLTGEQAAGQTVDEALAGSSSPNDAVEMAAANDRFLRLQAEMQNLRNRTSREINDERRYAAIPVLRDLLPVIDNIDRAIDAAAKAGEAENLLAGFRLVRQQLATLLTQNQCEAIDPTGQPFDPNFHQAILQQPSADVPAAHVMMTAQPGYKLHDRVIRPAQVIVSSGPA